MQILARYFYGLVMMWISRERNFPILSQIQTTIFILTTGVASNKPIATVRVTQNWNLTFSCPKLFGICFIKHLATSQKISLYEWNSTYCHNECCIRRYNVKNFTYLTWCFFVVPIQACEVVRFFFYFTRSPNFDQKTRNFFFCNSFLSFFHLK